MIAVLIPVLNAERTLGECLGALTRAAIDGLVREVIIIDGGSQDASLEVADDAGADIVSGQGDRGAQLAAGLARAKSPWILTLRQDTRLLSGWEAVAARHLETAPDAAGWFFLRQVAWPGRLAAGLIGPGEGIGLLTPRQICVGAGGYAPGRAEGRLAQAIGRGRLKRLYAPVLNPVARDGQAAR